MSSLESSLTISVVGSSRNSWFWMTSKKCSWHTDKGTGTGSRLSAEGSKTKTERGPKSAAAEKSNALFQLYRWQHHLFSLSRVNKTIPSSSYQINLASQTRNEDFFLRVTRPENCRSSRQHWAITSLPNEKQKSNPNQYFHHTNGTFLVYFIR